METRIRQSRGSSGHEDLSFLPCQDDSSSSINRHDVTIVWHRPSQAYIGLCFRIAGSKIVVFQPFQGISPVELTSADRTAAQVRQHARQSHTEKDVANALSIYKYFDENGIPLDKQHHYTKYDCCVHPDERTICIDYFVEWARVEYKVYD